MEKKALKLAIILLVIPIIISIIIAIANGNTKGPSHTYEGNKMERYDYSTQMSSSNGFIYLSVFILVVVGVGVWAFVKKKGNV